MILEKFSKIKFGSTVPIGDSFEHQLYPPKMFLIESMVIRCIEMASLIADSREAVSTESRSRLLN